MSAIEKFEVHPAAEIFPLMSDNELLELAEDIKKNGLLEPITLHEGKVLDGRNRLAACELAGVEPAFQEWSGIGELPTRFIIAKNLQRRQLTKSQRAAIAAECLPLLREEARRRQATSGGGIYGGKPLPTDSAEAVWRGEAAEIAGKQMGVGKTMVSEAYRVKQSDPESFQKIKTGELSVDAAAKKAKTRTCSIVDCDRMVYQAKLCSGHYQRKQEGRENDQPIKDMRDRKTRIAQIKELAAQGYNSEQIGEKLGVRGIYVRDMAREESIDLPELEVSYKRKIDAVRVVRQTVETAEHLVVGLDMIDGSTIRIEAEENARWVKSLNASIRVLALLLRQLKKRN